MLSLTSFRAIDEPSGSPIITSLLRAFPFKYGINKKGQINFFDPDLTRIELMARDTYDGVPAESSKGVPMKYGHPVS